MIMAEYRSRSFCCNDSRSKTPSVISIISVKIVGDVTFDDGLFTGAVLKTDCIAYFLAEFDFHFFTDTLCDTHSCNSSRLSTSDHAEFTVSRLQQKLSKLSCLSGPRLSHDDDDLVVPYNSKEIFPNGKGGK